MSVPEEVYLRIIKAHRNVTRQKIDNIIKLRLAGQGLRRAGTAVGLGKDLVQTIWEEVKIHVAPEKPLVGEAETSRLDRELAREEAKAAENEQIEKRIRLITKVKLQQGNKSDELVRNLAFKAAMKLCQGPDYEKGEFRDLYMKKFGQSAESQSWREYAAESHLTRCELARDFDIYYTRHHNNYVLSGLDAVQKEVENRMRRHLYYVNQKHNMNLLDPRTQKILFDVFRGPAKSRHERFQRAVRMLDEQTKWTLDAEQKTELRAGSTLSEVDAEYELKRHLLEEQILYYESFFKYRRELHETGREG